MDIYYIHRDPLILKRDRNGHFMQFSKVDSPPETFRDDGLGPKDLAKKIGGPKDRWKEPGPIF